MTAPSISVVIADDHAVLRDGLRRALSDAGLEVVGEATNGAEAVEVADRADPDVVLMDLSMPVLDGIEATRRLLRRRPQARVLVLTMHADADLVSRARSVGAAGYVLKEQPVEEVVDAVRAVARGKKVVAPRIIDLDAVPDEPDEPADDLLTSREEEVLQALADGLAPVEVAKRLFISPKTVKNHLTSVYDKLGVRDRTQAVLTGLRLGIISLDPTEATAGAGEPALASSA